MECIWEFNCFLIWTPKAYGGFYDMLGYWEYDYFLIHKSEKIPEELPGGNFKSQPGGSQNYFLSILD